jgi:ubiquinone/menaquinone biosynthesis C-methylase UbiE
MNAEEYANLERMEREHWYYAGKRQLVREWLERAAPPRPSDTLLDCGAGTGLFAQEIETRCRVLVLDEHEESLRRLRDRFRPEQVLRLADGALPLADASLEYVTALDVLEHVPDDDAVVRGFLRVLKPGGVAIVTVPASMALWSDWDDALHHYRRYDRAQLRALFAEPDWEIVYLNYTNVLVFPIAWLVRKTRWLRARLGWRARGRSEDRVPPRWLNALLRGTFVRMARSRVPFPFGVSLVLVARRRT